MESLAGLTCSSPLITYVRAGEQDFSGLAALVNDFKRECDGLLFSEEDLIACPQSPGHPASHLRDALLSEDSFVGVAKDRSDFVGFLKFDRGQTSKSRHRGVFTMAVKQSHWGLGIGRGLLLQLEHWAAAAGVIRIELNVLENNKRAIRLYQREGYVFEGRKEFAAYLNNSYIAGFWMAKLLKNPRTTS